jgi:hypothetical protein
VLFHPRWETVLPHDSEGRIYLELDYAWVEPILQAFELAADLRAHPTNQLDCNRQQAIPMRATLGKGTMASELTRKHFAQQCALTAPQLGYDKVRFLQQDGSPLHLPLQSSLNKREVLSDLHRLCDYTAQSYFSSFAYSRDDLILTLTPSESLDKRELTMREDFSFEHCGLLLLIQEPSGAIFGLYFCEDGNIRLFSLCHETNQEPYRRPNGWKVIPKTRWVDSDVGLTLKWLHKDSQSTKLEVSVPKDIQHCVRRRWYCFELDPMNRTCTRPTSGLFPLSGCDTIDVANVEILCFECSWNQNKKPDERNRGNDENSAVVQTFSSEEGKCEKQDSWSAFVFDHYGELPVEAEETAVQRFLYSKVLELKFLEALAIHGHFRDLPPTEYTVRAMQLMIDDIQSHSSGDHTLFSILVDRISSCYARLAQQASSEPQSSKTSEIVTFNVCGESVCLLKTSIAYAIPGSQLAIRVLGDWTEGESTKDEQGRFIIVSY